MQRIPNPLLFILPLKVHCALWNYVQNIVMDISENWFKTDEYRFKMNLYVDSYFMCISYLL